MLEAQKVVLPFPVSVLPVHGRLAALRSHQAETSSCRPASMARAGNSPGSVAAAGSRGRSTWT